MEEKSIKISIGALGLNIENNGIASIVESINLLMLAINALQNELNKHTNIIMPAVSNKKSFMN
ncbi:MAG: hypothetical protein DDT22_00244 [candidate division WS2 bacterium]|nr:hypothetical protein [Bacillota bacterium]MBT9174584.1 hypothetical protein [Candidatus Lithacetigena glycinireducens]